MTLKKKLMAGTLCLAFATSAFAANKEMEGYAAKLQETARKQTEMIREQGKNLEGIKKTEGFKKIVSSLNLSSEQSLKLAQAIADNRVEVLEAHYASSAAKAMMEKNQGEVVGTGLDESIAKFVEVPVAKGNSSTLKLTPEQVKNVRTAIQEQIMEAKEMLGWKKAEIESHSKVMAKAADLFNQAQKDGKALTGEEAYVQAIMELRGFTREQALKEVIEKLVKCREARG